jgi:hypothetical protein
LFGGLFRRANSISNLWPESHRTSPWNVQVKDRLEGKLHELVCSGQLDLKTAQDAIAANWMEAYKLYVSPNPPISPLASPAAAESPLNGDQVWGQHQKREVLEARIAILWQNQTG